MDLLDSCLEVLRFCSESDFAAGRFLDLLTPLVVDINRFMDMEVSRVLIEW